MPIVGLVEGHLGERRGYPTRLTEARDAAAQGGRGTDRDVRRRKVTALAAIGGLALAGCTMATPIPGPNGERHALIECGASTPMANCYRRANQECPAGYTVLDEQHGFNRKQLRVRCEN